MEVDAGGGSLSASKKSNAAEGQGESVLSPKQPYCLFPLGTQDPCRQPQAKVLVDYPSSFRGEVRCLPFLAKGNHDDAEWWLNVYVMISRATSMDGLLLWSLPDREFFSRGPPDYIKKGLPPLIARAEQEMEASVARLRTKFPWLAVGASVEGLGSVSADIPMGTEPASRLGSSAELQAGRWRALSDLVVKESTLTLGLALLLVGRRKNPSRDMNACLIY